VHSSSQIITIIKPTLSFLWVQVRGPEKSEAPRWGHSALGYGSGMTLLKQPPHILPYEFRGSALSLWNGVWLTH